MRLLVVILLLAGCQNSLPAYRPKEINTRRPEDMSQRVLNPDQKIPEWLKRNYCEWVRYAYDEEAH